jgi:putative intracellular protease/amidase
VAAALQIPSLAAIFPTLAAIRRRIPQIGRFFSQDVPMRTCVLAAVVALIAGVVHADSRKPYTRNVAVVVYEGAEMLDYAGPAEVLSDAASFGDDGRPAFNIYTVSRTTDPSGGPGSQRFFKVVADYSIENAPKPDIVIIPGGNASRVSSDPGFMGWVTQAAQNAEVTLTVCTGAFLLAKAGMLDNLEVTTWYGAVDRLSRDFPRVSVKSGRRFVDNGRIITTAGISAGIDGSLHLVARLLGRRVADQVARYMEYHWTPEAYLSVNYQYFNPSTDDRGRALQTAELRREERNWSEAARIYRELLVGDASDKSLWFIFGKMLHEVNDHEAAADAFLRAAEGWQGEMAQVAYYRAACEYADTDRPDRAFEQLRNAVARGYDANSLRQDPALAKLRDDVRMQQITAK